MPVGHRALLCTLSGSFCFTCGIVLLETKWILFYVSSVAVGLALGLPEAWFSGTLLWPGHKVHFSHMRPLTS